MQPGLGSEAGQKLAVAITYPNLSDEIFFSNTAQSFYFSLVLLRAEIFFSFLIHYAKYFLYVNSKALFLILFIFLDETKCINAGVGGKSI